MLHPLSLFYQQISQCRLTSLSEAIFCSCTSLFYSVCPGYSFLWLRVCVCVNCFVVTLLDRHVWRWNLVCCDWSTTWAFLAPSFKILKRLLSALLCTHTFRGWFLVGNQTLGQHNTTNFSCLWLVVFSVNYTTSFWKHGGGGVLAMICITAYHSWETIKWKTSLPKSKSTETGMSSESRDGYSSIYLYVYVYVGYNIVWRS